jgi:hypothetical protein
MGFVAKLIKDFGIAKQTRDGQWPYAEPWHHHPIDLGSYAAGVLGIELGTRSLSAESVARMCGVEPGGHAAGRDVTSGGAAYLLLREAAQNIRPGEWLAEWRAQYSDEDPSFAAGAAIQQFGPEIDLAF